MRRRVSFYPDSGAIEDVTDRPTAWREVSDYHGIIDDDALWAEYQAAVAVFAAVEKRVFEKITSPTPFTPEEKVAREEATTRELKEHLIEIFLDGIKTDRVYSVNKREGREIDDALWVEIKPADRQEGLCLDVFEAGCYRLSAPNMPDGRTFTPPAPVTDAHDLLYMAISHFAGLFRG